MVIYLFMLRDIPVNSGNRKNQLTLEYLWLGQKQTYKLDLEAAIQKGNKMYLELNFMRMFYFFAQSRQQVNFFLSQNNHLTINLLSAGVLIGSASYELDELRSEKVLKVDLFKYLTLKHQTELLKWGLVVLTNESYYILYKILINMPISHQKDNCGTNKGLRRGHRPRRPVLPVRSVSSAVRLPRQ